MESHHHQKPNHCCNLTILILSFTILTSLIGAICFLITYIPLSRHQVHGKEAIIFYKSINILGLVLILLPFTLDAIFLLFLAAVFRRGRATRTPPPPPQPSSSVGAADEAASKTVFRTKSQMELDAIGKPDDEYMGELVLAFVREKKNRGSGVKEEQLHRHRQDQL